MKDKQWIECYAILSCKCQIYASLLHPEILCRIITIICHCADTRIKHKSNGSNKKIFTTIISHYQMTESSNWNSYWIWWVFKNENLSLNLYVHFECINSYVHQSFPQKLLMDKVIERRKKWHFACSFTHHSILWLIFMNQNNVRKRIHKMMRHKIKTHWMILGWAGFFVLLKWLFVLLLE